MKYRESKLTFTRYVCSKCPPLARTQARKRVGHCSTASSISDCSKPRHIPSLFVLLSSSSFPCHFFPHIPSPLLSSLFLTCRSFSSVLSFLSPFLPSYPFPKFKIWNIWPSCRFCSESGVWLLTVSSCGLALVSLCFSFSLSECS